MSDAVDVKTERAAEPAAKRPVPYDDHARALVEKWMIEIRAISAERDMPPLLRP